MRPETGPGGVALFEDGTERWRVDLGDATVAALAVGVDGVVAVGSERYETDSGNEGSNGVRLLGADGDVLWAREMDRAVEHISYAGDVVVARLDGGVAVAFDRDGTSLWDDLPVTGDVAVSGDGSTVVATVPGRVRALTPDGTVLWEYVEADFRGTALAVDRTGDRALVSGAADGESHLRVLDRGETVWSSPFRGLPSLDIADDGRTWAVALDQAGGTESSLDVFRESAE
ncbi:PQQ-binding-like beta-propeller repeat protein [Haloarculaceae archaeon H-GB11]|nr:PQQ-binding-like beta-propeller repeat protein [Haloarculaceae archaeon H-GB11]